MSSPTTQISPEKSSLVGSEQSGAAAADSTSLRPIEPTRPARSSLQQFERGVSSAVPWAIGIAAAASVAQRLRLFYDMVLLPYDAYYYMGTARSLASGAGYFWRGSPHTRFYPGYPAVTSLLARFLEVDVAATLLAAGAWAATAVACYFLASRLVGRAAGVAAALALLYHPVGIEWTSVPMSEGLFAFFVMLALAAAVETSRANRPGVLALGWASAGLAAVTRFEGLLLVPVLTTVNWWCCRSGRRTSPSTRRTPLGHAALADIGAGIAAFVVLVASWTLWRATHSGSQVSYLSELRQGLEFDPSFYVSRFWFYIWPAHRHALLTAAAYLGWVVLWRRNRRAAAVLVSWPLFLAAFHSLWYYRYHRFVVPALPVMALGVGATLDAILEFGSKISSSAQRQSARIRQLLPPRFYVALGTALMFAATLVSAWEQGSRTAAIHAGLLQRGGGEALAQAARTASKLGGPLASNAGAIVEFWSSSRTYDLVRPLGPEEEARLAKSELPCAEAIGCFDRDHLGGADPESRFAALQSLGVRFLVVQLYGLAPDRLLRELALPPERFKVVAVFGNQSDSSPEARRAAILEVLPSGPGPPAPPEPVNVENRSPRRLSPVHEQRMEGVRRPLDLLLAVGPVGQRGVNLSLIKVHRAMKPSFQEIFLPSSISLPV